MATYILFKICDKTLHNSKLVFRVNDSFKDNNTYDVDNNDISVITPLMHLWNLYAYTNLKITENRYNCQLRTNMCKEKIKMM